MPTETFYKIREIEGELSYAQYLDQQGQPTKEIIEQLEITRQRIGILINEYKENERRNKNIRNKSKTLYLPKK